METITKFTGVHRGADWFEVAVLTCGHEHHGHDGKGVKLPVGSEVECGLCAAGAPRPKLPTGGAHAAASMTPEARSERARKAAMARHNRHLIPVMVAYLSDTHNDAGMLKYPSLGDLSTDAYQWVYREARRAMGY